MNSILLVLLQILLIVLFSRLCARALKLIGQPQVIGEMLAGILLGTSVLGVIWPQGFTWIFPAESMPTLKVVSQIGLLLFMFVVGLQLNLQKLRQHIKAAAVISYASILLPFTLGMALAFGIYQDFAPQMFSPWAFALFMGIAMSITAFPVLARILQEKKLASTPLGQMALTCAAVDDVTAWCVLAAVIGFVKAGTTSAALITVALTMAYVAVMWFEVRRLLGKVLTKTSSLSWWQLAVIIAVWATSAAVTEWIGIHALFGAFFAGVITSSYLPTLPNIIKRTGDFSAVILLPVFFAYTGLRLQISQIEGTSAWIICAVILILAVVGKMAGTAMAARWTGQSWRESWSLGSLMNTRGLMELVVLNIGYDLGILSSTLFAMMVIMALVTTAMTSPLISWLQHKK